MMRQHPERVAWLVIVCAFSLFLTLCAAVPVGTRSYLLYSTTPQQAVFEVIAGTVQVQERGATAPIAVTKAITLTEGSTIVTDENSKGILTFFDGSTLYLFTSTKVTLREMRAPTFDWGLIPYSIMIEQARGRTRIGVAQMYSVVETSALARRFLAETENPHLAADLTEGSYSIEVNPATTSQITANDGTASVTAQDKTVVITRRQRTVVTRGNAPLAPLPAAQDLIVNGDFMDPPDRGWNALPDPTGAGVAVGKAEVVSLGDRRAIRILRTDSASPSQSSAITGVIQKMDKEVSDLRTMKLSADVRLHYQSLSGGGVLSTEYPLILRIRYRDQYGSEGEWVHGFYYQNTSANPTLNGEQIPVDTWFPYESGNLFELASPPIFHITSIQIYASGWDYESYFSNVKLIVE